LKLRKNEIEAFGDQGFLVRPNVFSEEEMTLVRGAFVALAEIAQDFSEPTHFGGSYFVMDKTRIDRIVWCAGVRPELLSFADDSRLLEPVIQLLGTQNLEHLICQAHFKRPGDGVEFCWHQDSENRGYGSEDWIDVAGNGSYLQTLIAVDAMTDERGPLMVWPGSQRKGFLNLAQGENRAQLISEHEFVALKMNPGDVVFFGPFLVHGSRPNTSPHSRQVFINGYAVAGANHRIYPGSGQGRKINFDKIIFAEK